MIKLIGFDLDNTIINYEKCYWTIYKKEFNKKKYDKNLDYKQALKNKFNHTKKWLKIQSDVYSFKIAGAKIRYGFFPLLKELNRRNYKIIIVSHKTKKSFFGENLRTHSMKWLIDKKILKSKLVKIEINFFNTINAKISFINKSNFNFFIDDLEQVLKYLKTKNIKKILITKNELYYKDIIKVKNFVQLKKILINEI